MPIPAAVIVTWKLYGGYRTGYRAGQVLENYQNLSPRQKARLKKLSGKYANGLTASESAEFERLRRKLLAR